MQLYNCKPKTSGFVSPACHMFTLPYSPEFSVAKSTQPLTHPQQFSAFSIYSKFFSVSFTFLFL